MFPHVAQGPTGVTNLADSTCCNLKVTLCAAAAFGRRIAQPGCHKTAFLEPLQCCIHACDDYFPVGVDFKLPSDCHSVCVVTQTEQRQEQHQLEVAEVITLAHMFRILKKLVLWQVSPGQQPAEGGSRGVLGGRFSFPTSARVEPAQPASPVNARFTTSATVSRLIPR